MKKFWIPSVLSFLYLGGVAAYAGHDLASLERLKPNEVGDFLAGVLSPLALFWLVFGYLMQSEELALQRHELELQRNELKQNNEALLAQEAQLRKSAELQEASLNEERERWMLEHEPVFRYQGHYNIDGKARLTVINRGAHANDVMVEVEGTGEIFRYAHASHAREIIVSQGHLEFPAKPLPAIKIVSKGPDGTWYTRRVADPASEVKG